MREESRMKDEEKKENDELRGNESGCIEAKGSASKRREKRKGTSDRLYERQVCTKPNNIVSESSGSNYK